MSVKYIDLFSGIGGFHEALNAFDAKCLFASEWDNEAARTYFENFGLQPHGDITAIDAKDIPPHDLLCAGFPCQAFSISGKQKGFDDVRGTLFFEIARILEYHKPKVLLLENVRNFEKHDNGNTLKVVLKTLKQLGYNVFYRILNASDFALSQNRQRIFIAGFRDDLGVKNFDFPSPIDARTSLFDVLEKNPKNVKYIDRPDMVFTKTYKPQKDIFGETLLPNRPIQIGYVNKGGQGERIYSPYGHAITLSAYGGGVGAKTGLYKIANKVRKLTPRECARLQGFSEEFILNPSANQCYKQFGNSVAVNVLKEIFKNIFALDIFEKKRKKTCA